VAEEKRNCALRSNICKPSFPELKMNLIRKQRLDYLSVAASSLFRAASVGGLRMANEYRAEVIGSLLRPEYLKQARKRWEACYATDGLIVFPCFFRHRANKLTLARRGHSSGTKSTKTLPSRAVRSMERVEVRKSKRKFPIKAPAYGARS
jgi:hypothetical protein